MIALSLPNKWLIPAARRVVAGLSAEFRKRYRRPFWRQPWLWASLSHLMTLWVLSHSLPAHDWPLSAVAALCFVWVAHHQGKSGR